MVEGWLQKGLYGRGLGEAGLEQEDRREDRLSVCVLTEPCGDKGVKSALPVSWALSLRPSPSFGSWVPAEGTIPPGNGLPAPPWSFPRWSAQERQPGT